MWRIFLVELFLALALHLSFSFCSDKELTLEMPLELIVHGVYMFTRWLPIKMASRGRPIIDLFTDLSQQHVACACHTRGPGACATSCCCDMSREFNLIWLHATCCCDKSWCHEACSCGEVSWRQLASCDRTFSCIYTDQHWFSYCNYCTIPSSLHVINQRKCTVFQ